MTKAAGVTGLLVAVVGVTAAKWTGTAPDAAAMAPALAAPRQLPRLVDVGADKSIPWLGHAAAIAVAGASIHTVNRWVGWKVGERAVGVVKAVAGVGVMLGGAYFVWTAM